MIYESTITLDNGQSIVAFSQDKTRAESMAKSVAGSIDKLWQPKDNYKPETKKTALEFPLLAWGGAVYSIMEKDE